MTIFHIARVSDWEDARDAGAYRISTRGATLDDVGYVHASKNRDQVERVAGFVYFDDEEPLCVLFIDEEAIEAAGVDLRYEDGGEGELFPHIYGPIDPTWVTEVHTAEFDETGKFIF